MTSFKTMRRSKARLAVAGVALITVGALRLLPSEDKKTVPSTRALGPRTEAGSRKDNGTSGTDVQTLNDASSAMPAVILSEIPESSETQLPVAEQVRRWEFERIRHLLDGLFQYSGLTTRQGERCVEILSEMRRLGRQQNRSEQDTDKINATRESLRRSAKTELERLLGSELAERILTLEECASIRRTLIDDFLKECRVEDIFVSARLADDLTLLCEQHDVMVRVEGGPPYSKDYQDLLMRGDRKIADASKAYLSARQVELFKLCLSKRFDR